MGDTPLASGCRGDKRRQTWFPHKDKLVELDVPHGCNSALVGTTAAGSSLGGEALAPPTVCGARTLAGCSARLLWTNEAAEHLVQQVRDARH